MGDACRKGGEERGAEGDVAGGGGEFGAEAVEIDEGEVFALGVGAGDFAKWVAGLADGWSGG